MITTEKLQKMICKFGPTELDKLNSWFPNENKDTIKETIIQSDSLIYDNGIVKFNENSVKIEKDITYDMILQIIDKYNKRTEDDFENKYIGSLDDLKIEAIKTFLLEKNTLEIFKKSEILDIYTQVNKKTGNKTYCVISKMFNEEVFNYLDGLLEDETLNIYYIDTNFTMATIKEFLTKDCNEIIKKYIKSYQLEETSMKILKITQKIGE